MDQPLASDQAPTLFRPERADRRNAQVQQLLARGRRGDPGADSTPNLVAFIKQATSAVQAVRKAFDALASMGRDQQHLQRLIAGDEELVSQALAA